MFLIFVTPIAQAQENTKEEKRAESFKLIIPVDSQLQALRAGDIQGAYEQTSDSFKNSTSYAEFEKYINQHPILKRHHTIIIKQFKKNEDSAEVISILDPETTAQPVQYLLVKQNADWKIWKMNVLSTYSPVVSELLANPESIKEVVQVQLQAIKDQNISKAYLLNSKEFQNRVSLDAFRNFLNQNAILKDYDSIEYREPIIKKEQGIIEVELYKNNRKAHVEFTLVIEENEWKIWNINLFKEYGVVEAKKEEQEFGIEKNATLPPELVLKSNGTDKLTFEEIVLGTKIDSKGIIIELLQLGKAPKGNLYVNVYIQNGHENDIIEIQLEHLEKGSKLPIVKVDIQQTGFTMATVIFAPPSDGWLPGHYRLHMTASTGAKTDYDFVFLQ